MPDEVISQGSWSAAQPDLRAAVLRWASRITSDKANPVAVAVNASPLLAWLEEAADEADLEARRAALQQQYFNRLDAVFDGVDFDDDDPDGFVREARTLYAFLTAGGGR